MDLSSLTRDWIWMKVQSPNHWTARELSVWKLDSQKVKSRFSWQIRGFILLLTNFHHELVYFTFPRIMKLSPHIVSFRFTFTNYLGHQYFTGVVSIFSLPRLFLSDIFLFPLIKTQVLNLNIYICTGGLLMLAQTWHSLRCKQRNTQENYCSLLNAHTSHPHIRTNTTPLFSSFNNKSSFSFPATLLLSFFQFLSLPFLSLHPLS